MPSLHAVHSSLTHSLSPHTNNAFHGYNLARSPSFLQSPPKKGHTLARKAPGREDRVFTLQMRRALDLDVGAERELVHRDAGAARLGLLVEDLVVDGVDGREVGDVGQEDVDLDDVVDAAPRGFEDGA